MRWRGALVLLFIPLLMLAVASCAPEYKIKIVKVSSDVPKGSEGEICVKVTSGGQPAANVSVKIELRSEGKVLWWITTSTNSAGIACGKFNWSCMGKEGYADVYVYAGGQMEPFHEPRAVFFWRYPNLSKLELRMEPNVSRVPYNGMGTIVLRAVAGGIPVGDVEIVVLLLAGGKQLKKMTLVTNASGVAKAVVYWSELKTPGEVEVKGQGTIEYLGKVYKASATGKLVVGPSKLVLNLTAVPKKVPRGQEVVLMGIVSDEGGAPVPETNITVTVMLGGREAKYTAKCDATGGFTVKLLWDDIGKGGNATVKVAASLYGLKTEKTFKVVYEEAGGGPQLRVSPTFIVLLVLTTASFAATVFMARRR